MDNKELLKRAAHRRELLQKAEEKIKSNLFGEPTPNGESMMLHTRQCPECQVGQAGPVPGKEGMWQCTMCGATYKASKGGIAEQLPYDAKFYGGGPFLSAPSNATAPSRNSLSSASVGLVRRAADFRGAVSQFIIDVRDAINGTAQADDKQKIGKVLNLAFGDGDLYAAIDKIYAIKEEPVKELEVSSEEVPV